MNGIERDLDPGVIGGDGAKIDWDLEYALKKTWRRQASNEYFREKKS